MSDSRINRYNEHQYAKENLHCRKETYVQRQYNVWMRMVDNIIIGSHFFPEHINITAKVYSEFLEKTLPNLLYTTKYLAKHNIPARRPSSPCIRSRLCYFESSIYAQMDRHLQRSSRVATAITWSHTHGFFAWGYIRDQVYQTLSRNRGDLIEKN